MAHCSAEGLPEVICVLPGWYSTCLCYVLFGSRNSQLRVASTDPVIVFPYKRVFACFCCSGRAMYDSIWLFSKLITQMSKIST